MNTKSPAVAAVFFTVFLLTAFWRLGPLLTSKESAVVRPITSTLKAFQPSEEPTEDIPPPTPVLDADPFRTIAGPRAEELPVAPVRAMEPPVVNSGPLMPMPLATEVVPSPPPSPARPAPQPPPMPKIELQGIVENPSGATVFLKIDGKEETTDVGKRLKGGIEVLRAGEDWVEIRWRNRTKRLFVEKP